MRKFFLVLVMMAFLSASAHASCEEEYKDDPDAMAACMIGKVSDDGGGNSTTPILVHNPPSINGSVANDKSVAKD